MRSVLHRRGGGFLHPTGPLYANITVLENLESKSRNGDQPKAAPRWKVWLKRLGLLLLGLIAVLIVFHQPIFFEGTRYFILRAAKQQNLNLEYTMSGSIFTTLSITDLRAIPVEPGPIQRLEIGKLHLSYSLWNLLFDGLPAFLQELTVRDVFVELEPGESLPPEKEEKPQAFKFPALIPNVLRLENINVLVRSPTGNTVVEGLYFSLLPDGPGALKIEMLDIPGVRRWTGILAQTTFRDRNFVLSDLVIGPEIALHELRLDFSAFDESQIQVGLDGTFFDAPISLSAQVNDVNASNATTLEMQVSGLVMDRLWEYLSLEVPFGGTLQTLSLTGDGAPLVPSSWSGALTVQVADVMIGDQHLGDLGIEVTAKDGQAQAAVRNEFDAANFLVLEADAVLPETFEGFVQTTGHATLEIMAPDLAGLAESVAGDVRVDADIKITSGQLAAEIVLKSDAFAASGVEVSKTEFIIELAKDLTTPAEAPWFQSAKADISGNIGTARFSEYEAGNLRMAAQWEEASVIVKEFFLDRGENTVRASGKYELPADGTGWATQPLAADFQISVPRLGDFLIAGGSSKIGGTFHAGGTVTSGADGLQGQMDATGRALEFQGLHVRTLDANLTLGEKLLTISRLALVLDDQNHIHGEGSVHLDGNMAYRGVFNVDLQDLSQFQSLVGDKDIAGALKISWSGTGAVQDVTHEGRADLALAKGRYAEWEDIQAGFSAQYSPDYIAAPNFYAKARGLGEASLSLFWKEGRLQITNLLIRQNRVTLLEGRLDIPLLISEWKDPARVVPFDQPVSVSLKSSEVRVAEVMRQFSDEEPPVRATTSMEISAEGTLEDLEAQANIRASGVTSAAAKNLDPATVTLTLQLKDDRLTLDGSMRQKLLQPVEITGSLPLNMADVIRTGRLDNQAPLDLRIRLPRTSLAAVPTLVPDIRRSQGTASVDLRASGTIANPRLAGSIEADIRMLRLTDPSLPPVNNFALRLRFAGDRLVIERCVGIIAGGTFSVGGNIVFTSLTNPVFDLRVGSKNALVLQNDDLSVRVSSALRVTGPLNAGLVEGDVWVTRSKFFRNIDILPIGLPGRPAPQPPPELWGVSFPDPPLRDWKFDVRIRTQDPLLVQSNLAVGRIFMDLRLGGTGLRPWMDGTVNIEELSASLPFSRLQINNGQIFFTQQEPFVPQLNITGTSTIRDYDVNVFISGSASNPEALFTSNPPLPQSEVVALIATGMTTTELSDDPNALAGRAAFLVFQRLYQKVFARKQPPANDDSLLSRIQFDIGVTDPSTGRQSTAIRVPLSDQIMLSGGLDVGGNFRGQVKYLIRFK